MTKFNFAIRYCSLCLLFFCMASCNDQKDDPAAPLQVKSQADESPAQIQGTWELCEIIGGFRVAGSPNTYAPGNGNIWEFGPREYQLYSKGQLLEEGPYKLVKDSSAASGRLMDALLFPNNNNIIIHYERKEDTLVFYRGILAADGTIEKYVYQED